MEMKEVEQKIRNLGWDLRFDGLIKYWSASKHRQTFASPSVEKLLEKIVGCELSVMEETNNVQRNRK
jgi:hypothetical protein